MRFLRRSFVGLFLLSLTVGLLAWAGALLYGAVQARLDQTAEERPARERVFAVNVVEVTPQRLTPVLTTFGEVRSRRTLDVRAPLGGRVVELATDFEEGGEVEAGQMLVRIDPSDVVAALAVARAELRSAEADLADARRSLDLADEDLASAQEQVGLRQGALARQRDLAGRGVGSDALVEDAALAESAARQAVVSRRQAVAQAEARIDLAEAELERRRIEVENAERDLRDTQINAAFDGTLTEVGLVEGGLVTENELLARLVDPQALEVSFRVSAAQYGRLLDDTGQLIPAEVTISLELLDLQLTTTGQIVRESASVGEGESGRLLFARITDPTGFRPGDFVTVAVAEPPLDGVALLPATAVGPRGSVLYVGEEDRLAEMQTTVLRRQGNEVIVDASGIAGLDVVAEQTPLLGAGIRVRPVTRAETVAAAETDPDEMVELTAERRARLVAFIDQNDRMPEEAKERVRAQLAQDRVPLRVVERLESRIGG